MVEKKLKLVGNTIDKTDINKLVEWLSQEEIPQLTKGPITYQLEQKWAEKIGTKYSVFVNSGSSAIFLSLAVLKELNLIKNKRIVVPALSWATDVSSPLLLDLDIKLCDCNLNDLACDLNHLENIFQEFEPAVFILVTPLGLVPEMEKIVSLCKQYDVILLEDVCESTGSKFNNQYLGSFGFASFFSTYFGHHISTIEGGFINTNNEEFYHALLMMRNHGWDRDLPSWKQQDIREKNSLDSFSALYKFFMPGMNLRSTEIQAFLGINSIDKLDNYSKIRNYNFNLYLQNIDNNLLNLTPKKSDFVSNFAYPIVTKKRFEIVNALKNNNVECRPLIAGNMAKHPFWINKFGSSHDFTNADLIDNFGFYIPNHQELTEEDIIFISNIINRNGN